MTTQPLSPTDLKDYEERLRAAAKAQPGSVPYTSTRPIRIPGRMQGKSLGECLSLLCPHIEADQWALALREERLRVDGRKFSWDESAFGGMEVLYTTHGRVEPEVSDQIELLAMDSDLVVLQKPAPLPVHPCGRFNKNTLLKFIETAWPHETVRPAHRIDAATTGILVLTRNKEAAHYVQSQFANREVQKTYLVRVQGTPEEDSFRVDDRIDLSVGEAGRRSLSKDGASAQTDFRVVQRCGDGTTLLYAYPLSGRTNQIRLHLQGCGFPIVGDNAYGARDDVEGGMVDPNLILHLHAHGIAFRHPKTQERTEYLSRAPDWASEA